MRAVHSGLRKGLDIVLEAFLLADLDAELHLEAEP
jgi:hypothetical protein